MVAKYNPWRMEGARKFLEKSIVQLEYTAGALMDYPQEGDMGRSIVMRDLGADFAKFFVALGRIKKELTLYEVNRDKIGAALDANPQLVGAAAQTILKRSRVEGDAYGMIHAMLVNPDGSRVSRSVFEQRMQEAIESGIIPPAVGAEILYLVDADNNTGCANEFAHLAAEQALRTIQNIQDVYRIS